LVSKRLAAGGKTGHIYQVAGGNESLCDNVRLKSIGAGGKTAKTANDRQ